MSARFVALSLAVWALLNGEAAAQVLVFRDVAVPSADFDHLERHQSVVIDGSRIVWTGPQDQARQPAGAIVIEGRGGTLMPGLVDGHVHMFDPDERWFYLEAGITTVMNWHGLRRHLDWRRQVEAGEMIGPRIVTAGPILDGDPPSRPTNRVVRTPQEAAEAVRSQAAAGYDFIKLYDNLSMDAFRAVADEARIRGLHVTGHVPTAVGLGAFLAEAPTVRGLHHLEELAPFWGEATDAELEAMATQIAAAGVYVFPTVDVFESFRDQVAGDPGDRASISPATAAQWRWDETVADRRGRPTAGIDRMLERFGRLLLALDRAGVGYVAGSDSPIPTLSPGRSLHMELASYRRMGLPISAVLTAATLTPARFLGRNSGRVIAGADADLILVDGDPTIDLGALEHIRGVVVFGRWTPIEIIAAETEALRARYRSERDLAR